MSEQSENTNNVYVKPKRGRPVGSKVKDLSRDDLKNVTIKKLHSIITRGTAPINVQEKACNDLLNFINKEREIDSQSDIQQMLKRVNAIAELTERIKLLKRTGYIEESVPRTRKGPQVVDDSTNPKAGRVH